MSAPGPCRRGLYQLAVGTRLGRVRVLVRLGPDASILTHGGAVLDQLYGPGEWYLDSVRAMRCQALDPDACKTCNPNRVEL